MAAPRVLFQGGVRSVLRVSLLGVDVRTATLNQLAFDAQGAAFKILARGEVSLPNQGSGVVVTQSISFEAQPNVPLGLCWFRRIAPGVPDLYISPYRSIDASETTLFAEMTIRTDSATFRIKIVDISNYIAGYIVFRPVD